MFKTDLGMPARQNIILGDRIPRIISICVCVVTIFPLLTTDYLQRHYVIGCGVSGSPFLIQHIGKVRNVECHLEFAATVFQHEDILRHMQDIFVLKDRRRPSEV